METSVLTTLLRVALIVLSVALVGLLLLQVRGTNLNLLGGSDSSFRSRRGVERLLFRSTIVVAILFVVVAVLNIRF